MNDIVAEADGWIDGQEWIRGDDDVGIGRTWREAVRQATAAIESGYASERAAWA